MHFGRGEAFPRSSVVNNRPGNEPINSSVEHGRENALPLQRGCGGCQWQHIAYDAQLKFKTEIVREQFARIGKISDAPVRNTIGMSDPWHYRNNVQFVMDADGRLCFRALESHDLVRIEECHILHPLLDEMFRSLEFEEGGFDGVTLRAGTRTNQKLVILEGQSDSHLN